MARAGIIVWIVLLCCTGYLWSKLKPTIGYESPSTVDLMRIMRARGGLESYATKHGGQLPQIQMPIASDGITIKGLCVISNLPCPSYDGNYPADVYQKNYPFLYFPSDSHESIKLPLDPSFAAMAHHRDKIRIASLRTYYDPDWKTAIRVVDFHDLPFMRESEFQIFLNEGLTIDRPAMTQGRSDATEDWESYASSSGLDGKKLDSAADSLRIYAGQHDGGFQQLKTPFILSDLLVKGFVVVWNSQEQSKAAPGTSSYPFLYFPIDSLENAKLPLHAPVKAGDEASGISQKIVAASLKTYCFEHDGPLFRNVEYYAGGGAMVSEEDFVKFLTEETTAQSATPSGGH